jgi:glycosyltransferase involved in cell wall biosynthesis
LSATNFFGGPEKQIIGHALAVNRERFAVSVAAFAEDQQETELVRRAIVAGLEGWTVPVRNAYDPRAPRRIARLLAREDIALLVTHNYRSNLLGRIAARAHGIPHLTVSRGWTKENLKVRLYHWLDKRTLHKSDCIVCVSQNKKNELSAAGIPSSRLIVIPNAVDINDDSPPTIDWRKKYGWEKSTRLVVCAGRLSFEKGPDLFLAAARDICTNDPQTRFIIFGDGPLAGELSRQIMQNGLGDMVKLGGHVPELSRELPGFDLLVNPSRMEGLPNIILEAMVARLPVVATAVGGVGELIKDRQTGRLVPPDAHALAAAVIMALAAPETAKLWATRAWELARDTYSFAAQARRYEELYDRLLTRKTEAGEG